MQYNDGRPVTVGDRVRLWENQYGVVVCSIDDAVYTADYPETAWAYLASGVLIRTDNGSLFHYTEADEDFELIQGAGP